MLRIIEPEIHLKKLRIASFNSKFTGSYNTKIVVGVAIQKQL